MPTYLVSKQEFIISGQDKIKVTWSILVSAGDPKEAVEFAIETDPSDWEPNKELPDSYDDEIDIPNSLKVEEVQVGHG